LFAFLCHYLPKLDNVFFFFRNKIVLKSRKLEDWWKSSATDNVWTSRYYRWRVYSFEEGVRCHQETHHPTIYNQPNAPLNVTIELDMKAEKKVQYLLLSYSILAY
jgi:hypothetical protein